MEHAGEDAMTSRGGPGTTLLVDGGGAFFAEDKGLSVNDGGNVIIRNFYVDGWTRAFRTGGGPNVKVLLENVVLNNGTQLFLLWLLHASFSEGLGASQLSYSQRSFTFL